MKKSRASFTIVHSNPAFEQASTLASAEVHTEAVTAAGVTRKILMYLGLCIGAALLVAYQVVSRVDFVWDADHGRMVFEVAGLDNQTFMKVLQIFSVISGGAALVLGYAIIFKPDLAPTWAPVYAVSEGLGLGVFSALIHVSIPKLPFIALLCVFAVFSCMLFLYRIGLVRPTAKFRSILLTVVIFLILASIGLSIYRLYTGSTWLSIADTSWVSIGFSAFMVGIASLFFILDFANIDAAIEAKVPKEYEAYLAFGCLLTFIWVYLEILKLLIKIASRVSRS